MERLLTRGLVWAAFITLMLCVLCLIIGMVSMKFALSASLPLLGPVADWGFGTWISLLAILFMGGGIVDIFDR